MEPRRRRGDIPLSPEGESGMWSEMETYAAFAHYITTLRLKKRGSAGVQEQGEVLISKIVSLSLYLYFHRQLTYTMDQTTHIQKQIFTKIREKLPHDISFVHEISEFLGISYDSAYRRIRGEKELSLDELHKLCSKYNLSLDTLFGITDDIVVFHCHAIEPGGNTIKEWLQKVLIDIKKIKSSPHKNITYAAKDPPIFHYFQFPEIGAFKVFFWEKTLFQFPEYAEKRFSFDIYDQETQDIGNQILSHSCTIPTTEIWNEDTFNITLRQIEYYWVAGMFENREDVWILCDKLELWIRHIQKQAELGFKFLHGKEPEGIPESFRFYENEVVLNDNSILVDIDPLKICYLTFNVMSLLVTTDPVFSRRVETYLNGLLSKSTLISKVADKERNRFFNKLIDNIERFRNRIQAEIL